MENQSGTNSAVVAVFTRHQDAENAVRKLAGGGFDMTHYSIVGQGYHSEEKVVVLLCHKRKCRSTAPQCGQCPRTIARATPSWKRSVVIEFAT